MFFSSPLSVQPATIFVAFSSASQPALRRLDKGGKILLPSSYIRDVSRVTELSFALQFRMRSETRTGVAGVLEFTMREGEAGLPRWMMDYLELEEGALVSIHLVRLPPADIVRLRPRRTAFTELHNPQVLLEDTLRNFSTLWIGQPISVHHLGEIYVIDVVDITIENGQRRSAISVAVDSELKVDFEHPLDMPLEAPSAPKTADEGSNVLQGHHPIAFGLLDIKPPTLVSDFASTSGGSRPQRSEALGDRSFTAFEGKGKTVSEGLLPMGEYKAQLEARQRDTKGEQAAKRLRK